MMEKYIDVPGRYNNLINCQPLNNEGWEKTAEDKSGKLDSKVIKLVQSIRPDPDKHIYTLLTALGAAEAWGSNSNADWFHEHDLQPESPLFGHKTFLNAGVYTHHKNKDKSKSLGQVLLSIYNPIMRRVELIERVDRDKAKQFGASDIYNRLNDGENLDVSMGCKVKYDVCLLCGNKAPTRAQYCEEMRTKPGKILPNGMIVAVANPRPYFFDISFVTIGAARNAKTMGKVEEKDGRICLGEICTLPTKDLEKTAKVISDADIGVKRKHEGETYKDLLISDILRDAAVRRERLSERSSEGSLEGIRAILRGSASVPEIERSMGEELGMAIRDIRMPKLAGKVKRQFTFNGLPLKIEYDKGDIRKGRGWKTKMKCSYGYIPKTSGDDGEAVDVYVNPDTNSNRVFIVKQVKQDKTKDEDKIMLGFSSKEEAKEMYLSHIPERYFGAILETSMDTFIDKYLSEFKKEAQNLLANLSKTAQNCDCNDNCCTTDADQVMQHLLQKTASIYQDLGQVKVETSLDKVLSLKNASQNKAADIIKNIPARLTPIVNNDSKRKILSER